MGLKNLVNKLVKPAVLSVGILAGSLYSTDTANAQSPGELRAYGDAFRSLGRIQRSGILPNNSLENYKFQQRLGLFTDFMGDIAYSSAQSKDFEMLRQTIRNNPQAQRQYQEMKKVDINQIPQTFIANYWKDFDRDGKAGITEFAGLNKTNFNSDESLTVGLYLPIENISGKSFKIEILDPRGKLAHKYEGTLRNRCAPHYQFNSLTTALNEHGTGTYTVAYYIDGKHWENREFNLTRGRLENKVQISPKPAVSKPGVPAIHPGKPLPQKYENFNIEFKVPGLTQDYIREANEKYGSGKKPNPMPKTNKQIQFESVQNNTSKPSEKPSPKPTINKSKTIVFKEE